MNSMRLLLITVLPLFHKVQCETFEVTDVSMCGALAGVLFIFSKINTSYECLVGPIVANDKLLLCRDEKMKV